jgi:hypothetical protein
MKNEFIFNEVMLRLKTSLKASSYNELAAMLGLSSSGFANLKKRNSIPFDKVSVLASSHNVSIDWLLTGEGEMLKGEKAANDAISITPEEAQYLRWLRNMLPEQKKDALAVAEKFGRWNQQVIERQGGHHAAMA